MKAITLYQPHASLVALRAKKFETRGWKTSYRGPLAIHAGVSEKYLDLGWQEPFFSALRPLHKEKEGESVSILWPMGCIIAIVELVNCWRIVHHPGTNVDIAKNIPIGAELDVPRNHPDFHKYIVPTEEEMMFGDWTPGRYAWELANAKPLEKPIPAKGKQRLWNWERGVEDYND